MKRLLILFVGVCICAAPLSAQDIESKLSGNTTAQGFTIKNGSGTTLFRLHGDGRIGMGTAAPEGVIHLDGITGDMTGFRFEGATSTGWSGVYAEQSGLGKAARFVINNTSSINNSLYVSTNGTGAAIYASSTNASGKILQANNGASTRFFVESAGNVGIGVDDATQDLDVLNNARFRGVVSTGYSAPLNLTSTGILTTATSDARMKTNIRSLDASLEKVLRLRGVSYNWKSEPDGGDRIGFIAQEVREVVPEVVYTNPTDGYLGLNYAELTALLAEAVKEQQILIDELRSRTNEVAALQARVRQLESRDDRIRQLEADLVSLRNMVEDSMPEKGAAHVSLRAEK